jgi:hypothetical protein
MLDLLISILISLGINFTSMDNGQLQVSSSDMTTLKSSESYQKSGIDATDVIIVNDGIDPTTKSIE